MALREDPPLPVWEHLGEFRRRVLWGLGGWLFATALAWGWSSTVLRWMVRPPVERLVFTTPLEPFLAHVKVALAIGFLVALPWLMGQAWLFVAPGLKPAERSWVLAVLPPAYLLFLGGGALGFFGAGPLGLRFLLSFSSDLLQPYLTLDAYLNYMTYLALGSGALFQLPVVLFVLAKLGLVGADGLGRHRRHVFIGLLIAAAILTPGPDIVGQLLVTLPAYLLYEVSILVVRVSASYGSGVPALPRGLAALLLLPFLFCACGPREPNGLYPALREGRVGFVDRNGKWVVKGKYELGGRLSDGLARFMQGGKWGYLDELGKVVLPPRFEEAWDFSEGMASVSEGGKRGFIDKTGAWVIPPRIEEVWSFQEGLAYFREGDLYGFLDKKGTVALKPRYKAAWGFSGGLAPVKVREAGGRWGFIDRKGGFKVRPIFENALGFGEGLAAVQAGGRWGFVDASGSWAIPPQFEEASVFTEGLAAVKSAGRCGYVDRTGTFVLPAKFEVCEPFSGSLASVEENGKPGYVDRTYKYLWRQK